MPAEGRVVAQENLRRQPGPSGFRHAIQRATFARPGEVGGGRQDARLRAHDAGDGFHRPGRPQTVADHALGGTDGRAFRLRAEHFADGFGLGLVVGLSACAVSIDVRDLFRRKSGVGERALHGRCQAASRRFGRGAMKRIVAHARAENFRLDRHLALPGTCERFEKHKRRRLAQVQTKRF